MSYSIREGEEKDVKKKISKQTYNNQIEYTNLQFPNHLRMDLFELELS